MNKKKLILIIILSFLALAIMVTSFILLGKHFTSVGDGTIEVNYIALDGTIKKTEKIIFKEGDLLTDLIKTNFDNVVFENGMIMDIEDFTTPKDWSNFISIYVNDKMSEVGLSEITFQDGTKINLVITEYIAN